MPEYIERDKILAEEEFFGEHATWDNPMTDGCMAVRSDFIMSIPAADVTPVIHAKWIDKYWTTEDDWGVVNHHTLTCSACVKEYQWSRGKTNYCPNCGAKMDGESNG